jgi:alpha-tubulin suppressor-like RCC1 family protein
MSFGKADHGKLGHGDSQVHRAIPTVVESMKQCSIVKIASMSTYSVVVDNSGGVFVWGTGK